MINHQYKKKLETLDDDKKQLNITDEFIQSLTVDDFEFQNVGDDYTHIVNNFINRYEWLGKPSLYTTHRFIATCKKLNNEIAGVVTFDMPIVFSNLLGEKTRKLERLISRGASASWTPKNLASCMIMYCIKWMVKNTEYRVFTAYSDTTAGEIGTIYQACNFLYLGDGFGSKEMLKDRITGKEKTTRSLRSMSAYKRYAVKLGIDWKRGQEITQELRDIFNKEAREEQKKYDIVKIPSKHKYVYVLGKDKKETNVLRQELRGLNKLYEYPKRTHNA